jgi:elongator complex protein 1
MCSRQLTLPSPLGNSNLEDFSWSLRTPIHASFSSSEDVIAILWENGHIELWNLHTRLGPGSGHVMDPVKLWGCFLQENNWQQLRQIILWITDHGDHRVVVLGTSRGGNDLLAIVGRELGDTMQTHWIQLPKRNGRLIASSEAICWQAYDGEIYDSEFFVKSFRGVGVDRGCIQSISKTPVLIL